MIEAIRRALGLAHTGCKNAGPVPELVDILEENAVPEDTGVGYTEFFDWLAGTSDAELILLGSTYKVPMQPAHVNPMNAAQRYDLGLAIWRAM